MDALLDIPRIHKSMQVVPRQGAGDPLSRMADRIRENLFAPIRLGRDPKLPKKKPLFSQRVDRDGNLYDADGRYIRTLPGFKGGAN